jgi:glycosyltransferase involved in cell wall biosynthesis
MFDTREPLILRVLTRLGAGGPPVHALLVSREMRRLGYQTELVTGRCEAEDGDMSYLLTPADTVRWVPEMSRSISLWSDAVALWRLFRLMRRRRPLIVHTHTAKAGLLGRIAAHLAGVPVVVHTFHGNVLSGYFNAPVSRAFQLLERALGWITDAICVLAPQQAAELGERFRIAPPDKIHLVPLGMDLSRLQALDPVRRDGGPLVVGWLGRLAPVKNPSLLAEVIEAALTSTDRIRFVIAGDGLDREAVVRVVSRFGERRVSWLGWQRDVVPVIAQCHLLVQTSRNEGTPVALIEGMAAGRPFVSTPAGGVVDMVAGQERRDAAGARWFSNAVLVDPHPGAFAAVLQRLLEDPGLLCAMGRQAAGFARRYELAGLLDNLDRLYRDILSRKALDASAAAPARPARLYTDLAGPAGSRGVASSWPTC